MLGKVIMGAVLGGAAVWIWRNDIQSYVDRLEKNGSGLRGKVADTLQQVQETAESVLDRTKQRVSSGLESGREAIRPSGDLSRP
jgi:hypothetical protein